MKKEFTITIYTEDIVGILNRVTIVFTKRNINIESITASESEIKNIHRYTIVVSISEDLVKKVVLQLEKQVEVIKAYYYKLSDVVYKEIALYKMSSNHLSEPNELMNIIITHKGAIINKENDFFVVEKTGSKIETQNLFNELKQFGILEFVRSGRVAIKKPMKTLEKTLNELN